MSLRSTAACLGTFEKDDVDEEEFPNLPIKDKLIRQERITPFIDHFTRIKILGKGGNGGVYLAKIYTPRESVVALKFPRAVKWSAQGGESDRSVGSTDSSESTDGSSSDDVSVGDSEKDVLREEAKVLQTLSEGPYAASRFPAGTPYNILTSEYMRTIGMEVLQMKKHPGYRHIHRILDFNEDLPCIVSRAHTGALDYGSYPLSASSFCHEGIDEWLAICRQLCQAVEYLHWMNYSHNDIKPVNILYDKVKDSKDTIHIYLADFGLSAPLGGTFYGSTPLFKPPERGAYSNFPNTRDIDQYAVVMTLLALMDEELFPCTHNKVWRNVQQFLDLLPDDHIHARKLCEVLREGLWDCSKRRQLYGQFLGELGAKVTLPPFIPTPRFERDVRLREKRPLGY